MQGRLWVERPGPGGWPQVAAGLTGSVELYRVVDEVQTSVHGTQGGRGRA
jgi:hypothetical protein